MVDGELTQTRYVDSAWGYSGNANYTWWIANTDDSPDRWERLREARPPRVFFWYRASPVRWPSVPREFVRDSVSATNPPWSIAGEVD